MVNHAKFIKRAYALAQQAAVKGDHPFSALLVVRGQIVLECLNTVNTNGDVTRHPELDILRLASSSIALSDLEQAVLYASIEPCASLTALPFGWLFDQHDNLLVIQDGIYT